MGEEPSRQGLRRTPLRVKQSLQFLTSGYQQDPAKILSRTFNVRHDEMVVVKDIDFFSLCVHGKSIVYTPEGYRFARTVQVGDRLLTIDPPSRRLVETEVLAVSVTKNRERFVGRSEGGRG